MMFYTFIFFPVMAKLMAAIAPVFSVTWSFRNHSDLVLKKRWKELLLNIFYENWIFSGFFD